jgi:hypothetical protein
MLYFKLLWNQDPVEMAKGFLGPCRAPTPIEALYSKTTDFHSKWQRFFLLTFTWIVEDSFRLRVLPKKAGIPEREATYNEWRAYPERPLIVNLDLGGFGDIPVRHMGVFDGGLEANTTLEPRHEDDYDVASNDTDEDLDVVMDDLSDSHGSSRSSTSSSSSGGHSSNGGEGTSSEDEDSSNDEGDSGESSDDESDGEKGDDGGSGDKGDNDEQNDEEGDEDAPTGGSDSHSDSDSTSDSTSDSHSGGDFHSAATAESRPEHEISSTTTDDSQEDEDDVEMGDEESDWEGFSD